MIVERLRLQNFRSYENQDLDFSPGISLFEGDIGSGKSSLLFAVEFALFGLADVAGEHLLRAGEKAGLVELAFRAGGKRYTLGRRLARNKSGSVEQKDAYLVQDGAREELSSTQLREAVVKILGFREAPNPRAKSQIFRYGVFTPQEEMKAILEQKPEERKQTLRRAFGVEEYKRARENADLVKAAIREMTAALEGRLEEAPRLEEERKRALAERDALARQLDQAEGERAAAADAVKQGEAEVRTAEELDSRAREVEREIATLSAEGAKLEERRAAAERSLEEIRKVEGEVAPLRESAAALPELAEGLASAEAREAQHNELTRKVKVEEARFGELVRRKDEIEHETARLRAVIDEAETIVAGRRELAAARKRLEGVVEDLTRAREAAERVKELERRLAKLEKEARRISDIEGRLRELGAAVSAGEKAASALRGLEKRIAQAQDAQGASGALLRRLEGELDEFASLRGKARCPKCKQPISGEHLAEHRKELEGQIAGAKRDLGKAQGAVRSFERERTELAKARDEGEGAHRAREALASELARSREAAEEAKALRSEIEKTQKAAARERGLAEERKALESEVTKKAVFDKRAGELDVARHHSQELSTAHRKVLDEIEASQRTAKEAGEALARVRFDPDELKRLRESVARARDAASRLRELDRKIASKPEAEGVLARAREGLAALREREVSSKERLAELSRLLEERPLPGLRKAHREAAARAAAAGARASGLRDALARQGEALERADARLGELASARLRLDSLRHARDFLEQCFQVALERVELQVLADLNAQFNARFQEYFAPLMEGAPVDVRIDAEFSPEVLQGTQPLPVGALSGGERTSIALAYRLALNMLVSRAAGMETPDLLILDEPTDGFSKEQLARVGEVLRQIDCQQVILVSHERELESCADQVFEVVKDGTVSRVVAQ